jgi:hypothetical protein
MKAKLSPELQKLIKRNPLASSAETDRVFKGDLDFGAQRYAALAHSKPEAWAVYFAIAGENGASFDQAVANVALDACAGLARWCFSDGRDSVGIVAFRRLLLESTSAPLEPDCERFLEAVSVAEGEAAAAEARALVTRRLPPKRAVPQAAVVEIPLQRREHAGFSPVPSAAGAHTLGGFDIAMPVCPACGVKTRLWLCFDVEAEPCLAALKPVWSLLPLVSCGNCDAWRYRHDYQLDRDATALILTGIWAGPDELKTVMLPPQPPLERQSVALEEADTATLSHELQVGGQPLFRREPLNPACPSCKSPTVFVATLTSSNVFRPAIALKGSRYHFACFRCRTLSVLAQT